jgi:hypothetical protein
LADDLGSTLVPGTRGKIEAAGGKALVAIDPPAGRFFDGRTTIKFNPSLMSGSLMDTLVIGNKSSASSSRC